VKEWPRRILGVIGIGLVWAAVWAAVGALIGIVDPNGSVDDLWLGPGIGMAPGFLAGVLFSAALGIASGWRGLAALSVCQAVAFGGKAGLLVGGLPFVINEPTGENPLWLVGIVVIGSMTLLGAVSAVGSQAVARTARAERR
jgi:hypothetical protein